MDDEQPVRPPSYRHIEKYAEEMKQGPWQMTSDSVKFGETEVLRRRRIGFVVEVYTQKQRHQYDELIQDFEVEDGVLLLKNDEAGVLVAYAPGHWKVVTALGVRPEVTSLSDN
jgi:hypothetical protein